MNHAAQLPAPISATETTEVLVEQFDPALAQNELAKRPTVVRQMLSDEGDQYLPSETLLVRRACSSFVPTGYLLAKAAETCLVINSLKVHPQLDATVEFEGL